MCDINEGDSHLLLDFLQLDLHLLADLCIQSAQRLIQKQYLRLIYQGAGDSHTLLLSAGQQGDVSFFKAFQAYHFQHSCHLLGNDGLVHLFQAQTKSDVFRHIQMGKKGIFLENRVDLSFIGRKLGNFNSVKQYFAAARLLKACDDTKRRGFAASAGT